MSKTHFFGFHPLIRDWFLDRFEGPTQSQTAGWPSIADGQHTLIAAPTGSGKTLTAFLTCIDRLVKDGIAGCLDQELRVIYVSPLRALSNDMHRNLEQPLAEINALAKSRGVELPDIRVGLRTGDTSSAQRAAIIRKPPHILVTTPESLYLMLTAEKARERLTTVDTLIIDEIHALVRDKRGSHLALSVERLCALSERPIQRIGLSATQKPIETVARFLVGSFEIEQCNIIDVGHGRELDLAIETPDSELGAVCMHEQWAEVNNKLVELIQSHRSSLIFVNTRRMAERVTHQLTELLGEELVSSHHGSLAADKRLETERRLKNGELKAVVATASLELGLDVGYIDLVVQIGSPRSIAAFLQRVGRSGHSLGLIPKGRLFALTRDELLECMALIRAVHHGHLDTLRIPEAPLDVLAQQIVSEVAGQEWGTDALFHLFRRAYPYRNLERREFDRTVEYLSEGISKLNGRGRAFLHHDRVQGRLRARKGARITAASNGGAIPEVASFRVVAEPDKTVVGTLDEDFAIESNRGDIFLLGNTSWRILNLRGNDMNVADAHGAPPTIPFWRGEAPGRTLELSAELSKLREELEQRIEDPTATQHWLVDETGCTAEVAEQAVDYVAAQKAAIGLLPTQRRVVFERFFDESGGMQLVVHAPFGGDINRAWGFSMRKRFCVSFDFELQATADDNGFILSLGPQHSFPIESLFPMLTRGNAKELLEQAVLTNPLFEIRWRWNVTRALQVSRMNNGKRVPPALQRFRADDLLTAVFPKLTGCQEEHTGPHEIPDHPLVNQTMHDCLTEALDIDGLHTVLDAAAAGDIEFVARDTREPSPFAYELINSNPYTFLDGGEIQERRARAVSSRRSLTVESVSDLGRLDPEAIRQVGEEAQPLIRDADELHDAMLGRVLLPLNEVDAEWHRWFDELASQGRAATVSLPNGSACWVPAERLPIARTAFPNLEPSPPMAVPAGVQTEWETVEARLTILRGLIEVCGPTTAEVLSVRLGFELPQTSALLEALEGEGVVLRGRFTPIVTISQDELFNGEPQAELSPDTVKQPEIDSPDSQISYDQTERPVEWCHRRLLSRIHRLTLDGLRKQIEPVTVDIFMRFLARHHGLTQDDRRGGSNGLFEVVSMLQGLDVPAICWERDVLPSRVEKYQPSWLDELCLTGDVGWGRLFPPKVDSKKSRPMASVTRTVPTSIWLRGDVDWLTASSRTIDRECLSSPSLQLVELLETNGAMFASDMMSQAMMLQSQFEDALGELISRGLVTADGFAGLRQLATQKANGSNGRSRRRDPLRRVRQSTAGAGRWSLWRRDVLADDDGADGAKQSSKAATEDAPRELTPIEQWAWQLLRRWGVIFRDLLDRESGAPRWFELLQVYRRLEARGEIRGGRFITGVAGEQFALGDSVRKLRHLRDNPAEDELFFISAPDPLNLVGILTREARIASTAHTQIAYYNGRAVAVLQSGETQFREDVPDKIREAIEWRFHGTVPVPQVPAPQVLEGMID